MSYEKLIEKLDIIEGLLREQTLNSKKILTMADAMYLLGVSKKTLYRMIRQKKIPAYRPVKGKTFFIHKELKFWIMAHRAENIWAIEKLDNPDVDISEFEE
jgi:excisionase family DNA binding protein